MYCSIADLFLIPGLAIVVASLLYIIYKGCKCAIEDEKYSSASYDIVKFMRFDDKFTDGFKNYEFFPELGVAIVMLIGILFVAILWPLTLVLMIVLYFRTKRRKEKEKLKDN